MLVGPDRMRVAQLERLAGPHSSDTVRNNTVRREIPAANHISGAGSADRNRSV